MSIDLENTPAIMPMYKSLRIRKYKTPTGYKDGLRPIDRTNVGFVFPFERTREDIVDGLKTIL